MTPYTYRFNKISVKRRKVYRDVEGKKRTVTREFYQTFSPFNKNANGEMKTKTEIKVEISAEADAWLISDSVSKDGKF